MELAILIGIVYLAVTSTLTLSRQKRGRVQESPAIASGDSHELVKTWVEPANFPGVAGWKWKCSCGGTGTATNVKSGSSLGSEENAIQMFGIHKKMYGEVNGNHWKDKYEELEKKCYCKDVALSSVPAGYSPLPQKP